ncbi:hypothetical protein CHS0354_007141 [Potamilus streckersoni]|uniref:EGF-like domain-containing protein n=1 Tax=Potamilus streckersoni TaxID=2493646 RepID=A0AAE0SN69_9BIVA|nr:hypothetical protein CHS0354_007141 [Potamilus streckersoni]
MKLCVSRDKTRCLQHEFQCLDGSKCITKSALCDKEPDCPDHSDEFVCPVQDSSCDHEGSVMCSSGECIPKEWMCDGQFDCLDGNDELCEASRHCDRSKGGYLCSNQRHCISMEQVCDGLHHCADRSDEGGVCDIDECADEDRPRCSHICSNLNGSYVCTCYEGYTIGSDNTTCFSEGPDPMLIYAGNYSINICNMKTRKSTFLEADLDTVLDMAIGPASAIYWTDSENKTVYSSIISQQTVQTRKQIIVDVGVGFPEGLVVDWLTSNLYIVDTLLGHILACSPRGDDCAIILENLYSPVGVTLDSWSRSLYWTDWGQKRDLKSGQIGRAGLDGVGKFALVTGLSRPSGITLDSFSQRLFWVDEDKLHPVIESVRLDGTDRKVVISYMLDQPFRVSVIANTLYWTDQQQRSIMMADKFTGLKPEKFISNLIHPSGLQVYHSFQFNKIASADNPCKKAFCSHVCLLSNSSLGYKCACPVYLSLGDDGVSCQKNSQIPSLVISSSTGIYSFPLQYIGDGEKQGRLLLHTNLANTIDVDMLLDTVVFYNKEKREILMVPRTISALAGEGEVTSLYKDVYVDDLAVDWSARNVYWTDSHTRTVRVGRLDKPDATILISRGVFKPSAVILDVNAGFIYYADHGHFAIFRCHMDGTNCILVAEVGNITALALDHIEHRLYWTDSTNQQINSIFVNGAHNRKNITLHTVRSSLGFHPYSLAITDWLIFFTDINSHRLHYIEKGDTSIVHTSRFQTGKMNHLALWDPQHFEAPNGCSQNNGNCSHICLAKPAGQRSCACPIGWLLNVDNKTCSEHKHLKAACPLECENDGVCYVVEKQAYCRCPPFLTGAYCEFKLSKEALEQERGNRSEIISKISPSPLHVHDGSSEKTAWIAGVLLCMGIVVLIVVVVVIIRNSRQKGSNSLLSWIHYHKANKEDDSEHLISSLSLCSRTSGNFSSASVDPRLKVF